MAISEFSRQYHEKMFPGYVSGFLETDPEFIELFDNFAFDEVINMPDIGGKEVDGRIRHIALLATLLCCQGIDEFKAMVPAAMNFGVTPVEIKEITYQVAEDHGFTAITDFQILDENGSMSLPVTGGTHLTEDFVGAAFADYDSYLILSHFKGHAMAGFGGAIKNISIGLGSSEGKSWIHTGGTSKRGISGDQDAFLESMGEAGTAVVNALGSRSYELVNIDD